MLFGRLLGTRRQFCAALGGTALFAADRRRLTWTTPMEAAVTAERHYRVDAQIVFASVPLLHRKGVGGGSVGWRESAGGELRLLEFEGFSLPDRAAGLNRLGFIRELTSRIGGETESIYFGLMTASPEETAEAARKALHSNKADTAYTAIDGRLGPGTIETVIAHFNAPTAWSAKHRVELVDRARQALASASVNAPECGEKPGDRPFLQALADSLPQAEVTQASYIYSGRRYLLQFHRAADAKMAAYFAGQGLLARNAGVVRVSGTLRREAGGKDTNFRLWIEAGVSRPIPLRIEYQPKSYLRLSFEVAAI